jgi:GTP-binding protein Era
MSELTTAPEEKSGHVSGFVSILGRPNAGKSTLMNALIGTKLSIVADKPQTTRNIVQGVLTTPRGQVVFLDTPGILDPKNLLHRRMTDKIRTALEGRDLLLFLADASRAFAQEDDQALAYITDVKTPALLLLNKVDRLANREEILPVIEAYRTKRNFEQVLPISALNGEGMYLLRESILKHLPEGPAYFPEDYLTDQPERFLAAELIREQILLLTHKEVPHSIAVMVDKWEESARKDGVALTRIMATIHVERPGHKGIVIGEKGAMLKEIGTHARIEIEKLLDRKVFLELFVKVSEGWREHSQFLNDLDQTAVSQRE